MKKKKNEKGLFFYRLKPSRSRWLRHLDNNKKKLAGIVERPKTSFFLFCVCCYLVTFFPTESTRANPFWFGLVRVCVCVCV